MIPGLNKRVFNLHDLVLCVILARKHLRLMVLLICMCFLAGLAVYDYSRPVYFSRSLVRIEQLALPVDSDSVYHDGSLGSVIAELESPDDHGTYGSSARNHGGLPGNTGQIPQEAGDQP